LIDPRAEDKPATPAVPTPRRVNPRRIKGGKQHDDAAITERIDLS